MAILNCNNPNSSSGQWNYPPPPPRSKLLDLDRLLEDAVCFCNKGCWRDYILKKEKKRKLKEAMFGGGVNDRCLTNDYTVKAIKEIWGVRCTPYRPVPIA